MSRAIFTIGHSNHTWDELKSLLQQSGVDVLVDARSTPESRYAPFANMRTLPGLLEREGMLYIYMGDSLGGKPSDSSVYDRRGKPDYKRIRSTANFQNGLQQLLKLAEGTTVALMCAEEDPSRCHRRLLIGPALEADGVEQRHIRGDGAVQDSAASREVLVGRAIPNLTSVRRTHWPSNTR